MGGHGQAVDNVPNGPPKSTSPTHSDSGIGIEQSTSPVTSATTNSQSQFNMSGIGRNVVSSLPGMFEQPAVNVNRQSGQPPSPDDGQYFCLNYRLFRASKFS